jgi:hypothetical protein
MKTYWLVLVAVVLTSCASVPAAPRFNPAAVAPPGKANVYIYRTGAYPTLSRPTISIDGKTIFAPPEGYYTVITLNEGLHEFKVDWAPDTQWPDVVFPLEVEYDDVYIKISGSLTRKDGNEYLAGSYADPVDRVTAEAEMTQCCRYLPPRE